METTIKRNRRQSGSYVIREVIATGDNLPDARKLQRRLLDLTGFGIEVRGKGERRVIEVPKGITQRAVESALREIFDERQMAMA